MAKSAYWSAAGGAVAAVALATTVALAVPAAAEPVAGRAMPAADVATTAVALAAGNGPELCERIDRALTRRQQFQTRLHGDANTRGSIAWLQATSQALAATNPELSKLLADVAALRSQAAESAATIIADLQAVQQAQCG